MLGQEIESPADKPLKVVHVSVFDTGGGARAAHRLHTGLRRLGHESSIFADQVVDWCQDDTSVKALNPSQDFRSRISRRTRSQQLKLDLLRYTDPLKAGYEGFTNDRGRYGEEVLEQLPHCDVVNLHWIGGFIDYQAFFSKVPLHTPVVWTLHDMNAFTGGCHFDYDCGKFTRGCGACPQLGSKNENDPTRRAWIRKRKALGSVEARRLHVVGVSDWISGKARRSSLLGRFPVSTINLGLDLETFAPREPVFARSALGVPENAAVVLFMAEYSGGRRKGFHQLKQALSGMEGMPNLFLLSVGHGKPSVDANIPHRHLGYIGDDRLLSLVYSAADIFVMPSLQDNLPQTALQAVACGTPVVGFAVGGIPEMVRPGVTGELVQPLDVAGLRNTIADLLRDVDRREEISANCRHVALEEFSQDIQSQRYARLYKSLLEART